MGTVEATAGFSYGERSRRLTRRVQASKAALHINTSCTQVQENVMRGGQPGRSVQGRRLQTRPVGSIDRGVSLNRALWMLAEEMRQIKAAH
jgi:hypothetical protein